MSVVKRLSYTALGAAVAALSIPLAAASSESSAGAQQATTVTVTPTVLISSGPEGVVTLGTVYGEDGSGTGNAASAGGDSWLVWAAIALLLVLLIATIIWVWKGRQLAGRESAASSGGVAPPPPGDDVDEVRDIPGPEIDGEPEPARPTTAGPERPAHTEPPAHKERPVQPERPEDFGDAPERQQR